MGVNKVPRRFYYCGGRRRLEVGRTDKLCQRSSLYVVCQSLRVDAVRQSLDASEERPKRSTRVRGRFAVRELQSVSVSGRSTESFRLAKCVR